MGTTQENEEEILMHKINKSMTALFKIAKGQERKRDDPQAIKEATLMCNNAGYEITPEEVKNCLEVLNRVIDLLNEDVSPWEQDADWWKQ